MYTNKKLKKLIAASLIVGGLTFAPNVYYFPMSSISYAKVQMYQGIGEDYASEIESQEVAKLRARAKAIRTATEKAGVYLKSYSRSINAKLQDDEITAIASNSYQVVGDVKYEKTINQLSDTVIVIVWKATVNVNVDDSEIQSWLRRDGKDKSTIVTQTNEAIKAADDNTRKVEDLRKQVKNIKSEQERNNIKSQFEQVDKEFMANQKNDEGLELDYQGKYNEAIKKYNEALELKPDWNWAYNNRGLAYQALGENAKAQADFAKAKELGYNG